MEIIILDRHSLQVKDFIFTDKNFDIYLDIIVSKISTFVVSKEVLNARVGDLITIKQGGIEYLGIIDSIDIEQKGMIKLGTLEFLNVFALETILNSYVGNVGDYLREKIENNFIYCTDYFQSLPFLTVRNTAAVTGTLKFDKDQLIKIPTLIQDLTKNYNLKIKYYYTYLRGRIIGIELLISDSQATKKIKYNEHFIGNLLIQKNSNQSVNKVVFIPKEENTQYRDTFEFFLLQNNEITDNSTHELRYEMTRIKSMLYSDAEYYDLDIKASNELKSSMYDHNISFDLTLDNQLIVPMKDFDVGDYIEFIHNKDSYKTIVTSVRFHGTMKVATITLGEYRSMLTEKMSLLANKVSEQKTSSNTTIIGSENIDGGEF